MRTYPDKLPCLNSCPGLPMCNEAELCDDHRDLFRWRVQIREAAFEQAARVAEKPVFDHYAADLAAREIASAIRKLKESP